MTDSRMDIEIRGTEMAITRIFDAPKETVFHAFTSSEDLKSWWGPKGWTLPVSRMDFKANGSWDYCMQSPTGEKSCGKSVYHDIQSPDSFTYTDYFTDEEGSINPDLPEMRITVDFEDMDGKTKVSSRTHFQTQDDLKKVLDMGAEEGMLETWDRLDEYLGRRPR
jgi:uncharacterized protein YndB with AHSA1/START domain